MMRGEYLGRGIHALMLVEEAANIARKLTVFDLPGDVERSGDLFICAAYLLPTECAGSDERWQLIVTARHGDGLFVGAPVGVRDLAAPFAA